MKLFRLIRKKKMKEECNFSSILSEVFVSQNISTYSCQKNCPIPSNVYNRNLPSTTHIMKGLHGYLKPQMQGKKHDTEKKELVFLAIKFSTDERIGGSRCRQGFHEYFTFLYIRLHSHNIHIYSFSMLSSDHTFHYRMQLRDIDNIQVKGSKRFMGSVQKQTPANKLKKVYTIIFLTLEFHI